MPPSWHSRKAHKSENILPAIGGLTQLVHHHIGSRYQAGLWADDLRRSLVWKSIELRNFTKSPRYQGKTYVAPSWSWAALQGGVTFDLNRSRGENPPLSSKGDCLAAIKDSTAQPSTSDPYGRVSSGELHLSSSVIWGIHGGKTPQHNTNSIEIHRPKSIDYYGEIEFDILAERHHYAVVACILLLLGIWRVRLHHGHWTCIGSCRRRSQHLSKSRSC